MFSQKRDEKFTQWLLESIIICRIFSGFVAGYLYSLT